ncbi:MAG: biotin/lipoyl-binding protein, partial [Planctomycetota bacterium]
MEPQRIEGPSRPASAPQSVLQSVARTLLSVAILAGAGVVFWFLGEKQQPTKLGPPSKAPVVETVAAELHETGLSFSVDGVVQPYRDLVVAAESGGRVVAKSPNCRVGRVVKRGDVLLAVDPRDYELEVRRLEEELEQAQISFDELAVEIQSVKEQIALADETVRLNTREVSRLEGIRTP